MEILNAASIRAWDEYTILHEPIASIDLMERAASRCTEWLLSNGYKERSFSIYCGKGNNGGDGLAIARQLIKSGQTVDIYIIEHGHRGTEDFQANLSRLHAISSNIKFISSEESIYQPIEEEIIIDAIFGTGLNKPVHGIEQKLIEYLNNSGKEIISIDIPSGLFTDNSTDEATCIRATHTLSFQCFKKAFLIAENAKSIGQVQILDIGLQPRYTKERERDDRFIDIDQLKKFFNRRNAFSHKGQFGHAALIAGSKGMIGAAVLAARACMRSGLGKLTVMIPQVGCDIMQVSVPEAICLTAGENHIENLELLQPFSAIAIGPGLGVYPNHLQLLIKIFQEFNRGLILDADALNTLALHPKSLKHIPKKSIITPHPGEFDRLFGNSKNGFQRIELAREKANALEIIIVLKGRYTCIALPSGTCYFNPTGNSGLAKAGSGDVLTGIILGLRSQGYSPEQSALLSVYLHGLAADIAIQDQSEESLLGTDVVNKIGAAFRFLY